MGQLQTQIASTAAITEVTPTKEFDAYRRSFYDKAAATLGVNAAAFEHTGTYVSGNFLRNYLTPLPKQSAEERRRSAIMNAIQRLNDLKGPDVGLYISSNYFLGQLQQKINQRLKDITIPNFTIGQLELTLGEQEIVASVLVTGTLKDLVPGISPTFSGKIKGSVTLSSSPDGVVMATPSFTEIAMDQISNVSEQESSIDLAGMVGGVNQILDALLDNLNGTAILATQALTLEVPILQPISLTQISSNTPGLSISPAIIQPPTPQFGATSFHIDRSGVFLLADIEVAGMPARNSLQPLPNLGELSTDDAFSTLSNGFNQLWKNAFGPVATEAPAIAALSTRRFSEFFNFTWQSVPEIKSVYQFDTGTQKLATTKLRLWEKPNLSCSSPESCSRFDCPALDTCVRADCTRRECNLACGREPGACDKNCRTRECIRIAGRRYCTPYHNDPVCMAEKAACNVTEEAKVATCQAKEAGCNVDADADYAACQTKAGTEYIACVSSIDACNLNADADYGACQTTSGFKTLGCNFENEWHNWAGDIGELSGDAQAQGAVSMKLQMFEMASDAKRVVVRPTLSGDTSIAGHLTFTPYDIGHLLVCPWSGAINFSTNVQLKEQTPEVVASVSTLSEQEGDGDETTLDMEVAIEEFKLSMLVQPSPAQALIEQNPLVVLVCQPAVAPTVLPFLTLTGEAKAISADDIRKIAGDTTGNTLAGIFTGEYVYTNKRQSYPVKVPRINVALPNGERLTLLPKLADGVFLFNIKQ